MENVENQEDNKRRDRHGILKEVLDWVVFFVILIGLTFLINTYVGQRTYISGPSMQPTLHDGDNLIVDKISYRFTDPKRYDIIVFPYRYQNDTFYIKRIIGLPGETVQIINGYVYINGELREDEVYGAEVMEDAGIASEPITLGEDEYFVLGDNHESSVDSRMADIGNVRRDDIYGKIWFVASMGSDFGFVKN